ncbi:hypothetical protein [Kroppenstedtia sanguinis]|uniref:Uncharacterized protein n=1 Tax=Kroppenstedtia sanguinis TaxID=1380684 RepID=A0ABW4CD63_9BACL
MTQEEWKKMQEVMKPVREKQPLKKEEITRRPPGDLFKKIIGS